MSYLTIHLISDLYLGFNEFCPEEETIPDVDLVVINGGIGHPKRAMLYVETLCKKYPDTQFVYNLGEEEIYIENNYPKLINEHHHQMLSRKLHNTSWPKNLHYSNDTMIVECRNNKKVDILCTYGFPNIHKVLIPWEDTNWHKYYYKEIVEEWSIKDHPFKPVGTSDVHHGPIHIPVDLDWVNTMHKSEYFKVKRWELTNNNLYKILITHFNPYQDIRLKNQEYSTYNIHLDSTSYWLSSNTEINDWQFYGGRLFSNPGRGIKQRSKIIYFN